MSASTDGFSSNSSVSLCGGKPKAAAICSTCSCLSACRPLGTITTWSGEAQSEWVQGDLGLPFRHLLGLSAGHLHSL